MASATDELLSSLQCAKVEQNTMHHYDENQEFKLLLLLLFKFLEFLNIVILLESTKYLGVCFISRC